MKSLSNGCYRSDISVTPTNWNTQKASIKKPWKVHYRFYDPAFKDHPKYKGKKQVAIRRMNEFITLEERQDVVKNIIEEEKLLIDEQGYNPISGAFMMVAADLPTNEISPVTPLIAALRGGLLKMDIDPHTRDDIKSMLKYFEQSAIMVKKNKIPVKDISRKDIRAILDNCKNLLVTKMVPKKVNGHTETYIIKRGTEYRRKPVMIEVVEKKIWTANQFNHYRKYLSMIYSELEELEIVEYNPVQKIAKKEPETQTREVLTDAQRILIDRHLLKKAPAFRRYVHIFFHSGSRRTELLKMQGKHVDLCGQQFKVLIKKGKRRRWVWKTIKDIALPFWIEAMANCRPDDYVFSKDLVPGEKSISPKQITRRWKTHVKDQLGISVDLYSLKHLHTTEIRDMMGSDDESAQATAEHNSHTSTAMVVAIYDVKAQERKHKKVKAVYNKFA